MLFLAPLLVVLYHMRMGNCQEQDVAKSLPIQYFSKLQHIHKPHDFGAEWRQEFSAPGTDAQIAITARLREMHPGSVIQQISSFSADVLGFAQNPANELILKEVADDSVNMLSYLPPQRRVDGAGQLAVHPVAAAFDGLYGGKPVSLYFGSYTEGFNFKSIWWIVPQKDEPEVATSLVHAAGYWTQELHQEIFSFQSPGEWIKDRALYESIQSTSWRDIILDAKMKTTLINDVEGFFTKEKVYKDLEVPWKRGMIMAGPPGNGKSSSLKALMHGLQAKEIPALYVRTFTRWGSDLEGIKAIFHKARRTTPCLMIIEDIDSLITDMNRSAFLNEVDGLEDNDGLYIIGTTNHFEKLDPALRNRPSRFDRKFMFEDPSFEERVQYGEYWQKKLKNRKDELGFDHSLIQDWAEWTKGFSFAYLKESFLSTLLIMAANEDNRSFRDILQAQVHILKNEIGAANSIHTQDAKEAINIPIRDTLPTRGTQIAIRHPIDAWGA